MKRSGLIMSYFPTNQRRHPLPKSIKRSDMATETNPKPTRKRVRKKGYGTAIIERRNDFYDNRQKFLDDIDRQRPVELDSDVMAQICIGRGYGNE